MYVYAKDLDLGPAKAPRQKPCTVCRMLVLLVVLRSYVYMYYMLYCIVLYCIILYYIILYYII